MHTNRVPLLLRLAGLWVIWSAWCSCSGWALSAIGLLDGWGHLALLPVLLVAGWQWLKVTAPADTGPQISRLTKYRRRFSRLAPMIYLGIATLSLISASLYTPWFWDAVCYRLPRLLYWNAAHHWYWIGALDHRLDYSSCGYEWQALPIIELTRTDRLLFLLNWIPFLLMPGLVFFAFRALGVNGRSARCWMWLLPAGYCYALQSSGLGNDSYAVNYTLAAVGLAAVGFRSNRGCFVLLSVLSAALLTGAKLSNLPLLLPLGMILLPALGRMNLFTWKIPVAAILAVLCSFIPLALLSLKYIGDWTGDPTDQWNMKMHHPLGGMVANLVILANDVARLPVMPGSERIAALVETLESRAGPVFAWLKDSHPQFNGIHFGNVVYEGDAGPGFGLGIYTLFLIFGCWLVKVPQPFPYRRVALPIAWRLALWAAWISYGVYLAELCNVTSPRTAAPYYPLLLASLLQWPRITLLEQKKFSQTLAWLAALTVMPIIILTPARPLVPIQTLARMTGKPAMEKIAANYRAWSDLRDDLAPLRNALPPGVTKLGYAGAFPAPSYDLWKPFDTGVVAELGLPLGSKSRPPADLDYAVVTERGLELRYAMDLKTWLDDNSGKVVCEHQRSTSLVASPAPQYESWYLVKLNR